MSDYVGHQLFPLALEGLGVFLLAFFGADALFGADLEPLGLAATLPPALAATLGVLLFRLSE